jgi:Ser/Thr protein kinase RdoA (MazF antagonist)
VAALTRGLAEVPAAPIHRDLKPDHAFLSDERVTLIDLDSVAMGDPVRDPAHLLSYLLARVGLDPVTPERARAVGSAFVEEYFANVPAEWRARFPLHCAGALLEVASGIFRHQRPGWRERMAEVVAEARTLLPAGHG